MLCGESDVPPVEAGLKLSAGVEGAAVQRHDAFPLQLRERLSPVLKLTRYGAQCVVHPRRHLHSDKQTDGTAFFFITFHALAQDLNSFQHCRKNL